jgi:glucose/arabinose dehydrogenase
VPSRHAVRPAAPFATASADNHPHPIPRPAGALPKAPPGFRVSLFFQDGTAPRQLRAAPNGDLFLAESYAGQVRVLRPDGKGGLATTAVFATGRYRPFGIAFYPPGPNPAWVYVADNDKVVRYAYANGDLTARGPAQTVVPSLPQGGQLPGGGHWTRDLAFARDGSRLYVSVGSFSNDQNDGEDETGRADVLSFAPDGSGRQVVADGIRNPVSLAVEPRSGELWATVNERDGLGDNLVPDYVTRVRQGEFFGWPWYYLGRNLDPRHASDAPQVGTVTVPDLLLQAHSASLGLTFYATGPFPGRYRNSAFVALHGSWNRANRTGSKVVFAKVKDGAPAKRYEDFLTGFTVAAPAQPDGTGTWGRPVGVAAGRDGALYVSDDLGNVVWRVAYQP